jgi:hypothetical protein
MGGTRYEDDMSPFLLRLSEYSWLESNVLYAGLPWRRETEHHTLPLVAWWRSVHSAGGYRSRTRMIQVTDNIGAGHRTH